MSVLPVISALICMSTLEKICYKFIRQKGSHIITMLSMIILLSCNETDKLKKELVMKIMENPEKIDSLVMNSNFFDEELYIKLNNKIQEKKEMINYVNEYKIFGYRYGGNKIFSLKKLNSNESEKVQYFLITFDNQKIGIIFVFLYDDIEKKWYFENWGAFTNTLEYL